VQPKNVMFPTDARLLNRARESLVRLAQKHGVKLRQSYARVGKFALIQHQRHAHAKQFKREPVIGHLKAEHRMGRNYLWHRHGDASNAILAAVGYNFRRLIQWLKLLLFQILTRLIARLQIAPG
jgi:hypothetical protein